MELYLPHIFVSCLPLPVIFQTDCSIDIVLTAVLKLQPTLHRVRMVDALAGEEILRAINLARIEGGGEQLCTRSAVRRGFIICLCNHTGLNSVLTR